MPSECLEQREGGQGEVQEPGVNSPRGSGGVDMVARLRPLLERWRVRQRNLDFSLYKALPRDHRRVVRADLAWLTPHVLMLYAVVRSRDVAGQRWSQNGWKLLEGAR